MSEIKPSSAWHSDKREEEENEAVGHRAAAFGVSSESHNPEPQERVVEERGGES